MFKTISYKTDGVTSCVGGGLYHVLARHDPKLYIQVYDVTAESVYAKADWLITIKDIVIALNEV